MKKYFVYVVECSDATLYTGITTDVPRRIQEHNTSVLGAKYTKSRLPVRLCYAKEFPSRSLASIEEARIKKLSRKQKRALFLDK